MECSGSSAVEREKLSQRNQPGSTEGRPHVKKWREEGRHGAATEILGKVADTH